MSRLALRGLVLIGYFLVVGCRGDQPVAPAPGTEVTPASAETTAPPPPERLDAATLAPRIRAFGGLGMAPTEILVEFARPIVDASLVGKPVGKRAEFSLTPAVEGELSYRSTTSLGFRPNEPFPAGSTITATLTKVTVREDEEVSAPSGNAWSGEITIPAFALARAPLVGFDVDRKRVEIDLHFTDGVDPDRVARALTVRNTDADGNRSQHTPRLAAMGPTTVRATLQGDALVPGNLLEVQLAAGVASRRDDAVRAPGVSFAITLPTGPRVSVKAVLPTETGSGFAIDVVCDDDAVETERWYWDNVHERSFGRISSRCTPLEDVAAAAITIDPPVPFSVTSSAGGFRILAKFERGVYALRIASGLRTRDGGTLAEEILQTLVIPGRSAKVSFGASGRYLPRAAWRSLAIRHLNVSTVDLEIRQVPPENLVFWMSGDSEQTDQRTSDLVLSHRFEVQGPADELGTHFLDVGSLLPADTRGLLELTVRGGDASDTARIVLTDLQLVAKRTGVDPDRPQGDEVVVWAFDSRSLAPERGVAIRLVKPSGTAVSTCRTGGDGRCRLAVPPTGVDPTEPFALVAEGQRDLTYLRFADLEIEVQEERVAGEPWRSAARYRAAAWTERGVYRPGETVHLAAIVRNEEALAPPAGLPVVLALVDPRGRLVVERSLPTNPAGWLVQDLPIADFAPTGRWEVRLSSGGRAVGSTTYLVEEFVPERLAVEAKGLVPALTIGEDANIAVAARYLFGGVPADHRLELSCDVEPAQFSPKQNASFHFGVWSDTDDIGPQSLGRTEGTLDANGQATVACPGTGQGFAGPATLVARAAVFESGSGRTTVGVARVPLHPERFYLGLSTGTKEAKAGEAVVVNGVVVDWQGALLGAQRDLEIEVLRVESEYGWSYDTRTGEENWRRLRRTIPEIRRDVVAQGGKFSFEFTPEDNAESFVIRARAKGTRARTDLELAGNNWGSWWWWESERDMTPRPDAPTWVALEAPERIESGKPFEVRFTSPWKGRALLALETDRLVVSEWRDVEPGEVVWKVALDKFQPTAYASVFIAKDPHAESPEAFVPDRAHGVVALTVEPTDYRRTVELTTPKEVRSGAKLPVTLNLGPGEGPTFAAVAVVDEGILSLTRYRSPDPLEAIFARRALGVETFETIGWTLLAPSLGSNAATGGDQAGTGGRAQPVKPVALWSGLVEVPASGKLDLSFDLPAYRGQLRVMAVAADPTRIARADAKVTVRDPLVLQATTPRVLAAGDQLDIPVHVTNLSGAARKVEITLEIGGTSGGVEATGDLRRTLDLADQAAATAVFSLRGALAFGVAELTVTAKAGDLSSTEKQTIPLVPAGAPERRLVRLELPAAGGPFELAPHLGSWVKGTQRSTITVTANPYADAFTHLSWLLQYPYGCLEQTTSAARPLLFLGDLVRAVDPNLVAKASVEDMAKSGIERVLSMQTPAGGFGYWPGAAEPASWATAYATHFLLDARAASFPVPQARIDDALEWMEGEITNRYERGLADERSWYTQNGEPYMHYVLALAGRPRKARAEALLATLPNPPQGEQAEHATMLHAALFLAGDRRFEGELRRADLSPPRADRSNSWSFYSDRRRRGFLLSTIVDLLGRDGAERLADTVAEGLRGHSSGWYTTQELAWGITGLGKFLAKPAASGDPARTTLTAGGNPIAPEKDTGTNRLWSVQNAAERSGLTLDVPAHEGKLWLLVSSEGVPTEPQRRPGGNGLRLTRRLWTPAGAQLSGNPTVALGDLVLVELELENTGPERVGNLALVDRVAAGWEIENPRLGRDQRPEWVDAESLWTPDHVDVRDDRLEVFGHLEAGQKRTVVYAVRAVSAGNFALPPAIVEAMYDPSTWALAAGGQVEVTAPWPAQ